MCGLLMNQSESLADYRITRAREQADLAGRQRSDVAPQSLHEQYFRQFGEHQSAARTLFAPCANREPDGMFEPLVRGFFNGVHCQHGRQPSQEDLA